MEKKHDKNELIRTIGTKEYAEALYLHPQTIVYIRSGERKLSPIKCWRLIHFYKKIIKELEEKIENLSKR